MNAKFAEFMRGKDQKFITSISIIVATLLAAPVCTVRAEDALPQFSNFELRLNQDAALQTIARAKLRLATADFLPKVTIGSDWVLDGRIKYSPDITLLSPNTYADKDPSSVGIEASVKLFDGFQNVNNLRAARESVGYAMQASLDTRQKLLLEKAERAIGIQRDREVVRAYADAVKRRSQAYDVARKMLKDRSVTISQMEIAGAELQGAEASLEQARSALRVGELDYAKFTGRAIQANTTLEIPVAKLPLSAAEATGRAQAQSPQLKMAFHMEREAELKARAAEGRFLPTVSLVGRHTRTFDPSPMVDRLDNSSILVRATFPLFDPTIGPARDLARAEAQQRRYDRQDTTLELGVEAQKQHELYLSLSAQMKSLKRQVERAKAAANAVRIEVDTGERTVSELLDVQQSLLTARVTYAEVRQAHALAAFRLLATTGELDERDLARI